MFSAARSLSRGIFSAVAAYARCLFLQGEGFPLFNPQPSDDLPEPARRNGIQIGDVGVITPNGSFDPIFNILRPADDYANRFGVPLTYDPAILPTGDISVQEQCHNRGAVISNSFVMHKKLNLQAGLETIPPSPIAPGATVKISTASRETGVLILPHGASRLDVRSLKLMYNYAKKNAPEWYAFVRNDLQRLVANGGLYLITGVTKSTSWTIASTDASSGSGELSLQLEAAQIGGFGAARTSEWNVSTGSGHSGPHRRPGEETWRDNQTLFIRGFQVGLGLFRPEVKSIVKCKVEDILAATEPTV